VNRKPNVIGPAALLAAVFCQLAHGQQSAQANLVINLQNAVEYQADISDPSQFATRPNVTPSVQPRNFFAVTIIADIVSINGQPAKGMYVARSRALVASPAPSPGGAIADVTRAALREHVFEILTADGTPVGTIMSLGFTGGSGAPGEPSTDRANLAIVGGTGAFLGARGVIGATGGSGRAASMAEDPANRRINGGTSITFNVRLIPMTVPQISSTATGPAVVHSDFTMVSASHPAKAGEILALFATGLGPTVPEVDPGQSFSAEPLALVNSPVVVTVNGKPADVLAAVGYPGSVDGYQVNFRVPNDAATSLAVIQVSAAWIASAPVSIAIQ